MGAFQHGQGTARKSHHPWNSCSLSCLHRDKKGRGPGHTEFLLGGYRPSGGYHGSRRQRPWGNPHCHPHLQGRGSLTEHPRLRNKKLVGGRTSHWNLSDSKAWEPSPRGRTWPQPCCVLRAACGQEGPTQLRPGSTWVNTGDPEDLCSYAREILRGVTGLSWLN